jgi:hypothetical protein
MTSRQQWLLWISTTLREAAWAPLSVFGFYLLGVLRKHIRFLLRHSHGARLAGHNSGFIAWSIGRAGLVSILSEALIERPTNKVYSPLQVCPLIHRAIPRRYLSLKNTGLLTLRDPILC